MKEAQKYRISLSYFTWKLTVLEIQVFDDGYFFLYADFFLPNLRKNYKLCSPNFNDVSTFFALDSLWIPHARLSLPINLHRQRKTVMQHNS